MAAGATVSAPTAVSFFWAAGAFAPTAAFVRFQRSRGGMAGDYQLAGAA